VGKVIHPKKPKLRRDKLPDLKPAVRSFTHQDVTTPQEADEFRRVVRDLRRESRSKIAAP